jgi:hypothetical protein
MSRSTCPTILAGLSGAFSLLAGELNDDEQAISERPLSEVLASAVKRTEPGYVDPRAIRAERPTMVFGQEFHSFLRSLDTIAEGNVR